jgi:hypothetical protein
MSLEDRLADAASTFDAGIEAQLAGHNPPHSRPHWHRGLAAAAAVLVTAGAVPLMAKLADRDDSDQGTSGSTATTAATTALSTTTGPTTTQVVVEPTTAPVTTTRLSQPLAYGSAGSQVQDVQERLTELGFFVGPIDGQFGNLTKMAVWAFEKLVVQTPRDEATGVVTDDMWQLMQQPMRIEPRRFHSKGQTTVNHTEVYLPEQVVVFFQDDEVALISHMSSGTGDEWKEEVTIDVGEYGNENGTEPLVRGEIGVSVTPGGVFDFDRMVEGVRQSALGGMWDPAYFNYGIAIHGAMNVPLQPASHGCIRVPLKVGEIFHDYIDIGDSVFVWDGVKEPEVYASNRDAAYPRGQLPIFNRIDPDYSTTTTSTTSTTVVTTVPETDPPATQAPATQAPATQPVTTPAPTGPPTAAPTTVATTTPPSNPTTSG